MIDMNLSPDWTYPLRKAGYEALHWSVVGNEDDPDDAIMAWAAGHDHIVLTGDLDFGAALARSSRNHPSVVQLRGRETRPAFAAAAVLAALGAAAPMLRSGALLTIGTHRVRLTPLPMKT